MPRRYQSHSAMADQRDLYGPEEPIGLTEVIQHSVSLFPRPHFGHIDQLPIDARTFKLVLKDVAKIPEGWIDDMLSLINGSYGNIAVIGRERKGNDIELTLDAQKVVENTLHLLHYFDESLK